LQHLKHAEVPTACLEAFYLRRCDNIRFTARSKTIS
jgi:hypothetical protein